MTIQEYYDRCRAFSDDCAAKLKAVKDLLDEDPKLSADGSYEKYWKLQNAATTTSLQWVEFCTNNKPSH